MLYTLPDQWTEKQLLSLSGEDDRYEFKSGGILYEEKTQKPKADEVLCNELAVEICAFANSFGGALFLGVKNNKKIDGVPKFYKGKQSNPFTEWLEKKVAHLLEFRLPNYRVTEVVELSEETAQSFANDKAIIAIDIFDSDLAPHQCKHNNKYYYRQSSNSNPAPHHYLAYLWSRTSKQQSDVVNKWCINFFNYLIEMISKTEEILREKQFKSHSFFQLGSWNDYFKTLTADQFLRTFPEVKKKCDEFKNKTDELYNLNIQEVDKLIINSELLLTKMRSLYANLVKQHSHINPYEKSLVEAVTILGGEIGISHLTPEEQLDKIARLITCSLLEAKDPAVSVEEGILWRNYIPIFKEAIQEDFKVVEQAEKAKEKLIEIQKDAFELTEEFKDFRYQLCLKHNTTY